MPRGGRVRTTWVKGDPRIPRKGRPKGAKDTVPRNAIASIRAIAAEIILTRPDVIRDSMLRGFQAAPPKSLPYLTLAASLIGEGIDQKVQLTGPDGGPIQLEAVRREELQGQLRERLTRLLEAAPRTTPVIEAQVVVPHHGPSNGNGNGHGSDPVYAST